HGPQPAVRDRSAGRDGPRLPLVDPSALCGDRRRRAGHPGTPDGNAGVRVDADDRRGRRPGVGPSSLVLRSGGSGGTVASAATSANRAVRTSGFARFLRGGAEVWQHNAILWKELSTRRLGLAARIGLAILLFLLTTTIVDTDGWWRVLLYWVSWIVLLLVAIASGISLFVTEREERKW